MTEEEKEFVKKVNVDKAKYKLEIAIVVHVISLITYITPLMYGEYDFGIIFELLAFVFMLIAWRLMSRYDEIRSRKFVIYAMLSIGWLLIYDFLWMILSATDFIEFAAVLYAFFQLEGLSIATILVLLKINRDLLKADNPIRYKESTDWFYERLDDEDI